MIDDFFTLEEAQSKIGKIVEALRQLARTTPGEKGTVIEIDPACNDGCCYDVVVEWHMPNPRRIHRFDAGGGERVTAIIGGQPFRDYIRRNEYEKFLREV